MRDRKKKYRTAAQSARRARKQKVKQKKEVMGGGGEPKLLKRGKVEAKSHWGQRENTGGRERWGKKKFGLSIISKGDGKNVMATSPGNQKDLRQGILLKTMRRPRYERGMKTSQTGLIKMATRIRRGA